VLRTPNTWLLGTYAFVMLGVLSSMQGLWTVPYLRDAYGMSKQDASNILTMWAVGIIIASPAWGLIAARLGGRDKLTLQISVVLHAAVWALLVARPSGLPVPVLYGTVLIGGFTNGCWIAAYSQMKRSVPAAVVGTAMGLINFAFFTGGAVFQQVTGVLIDRLTPAGGHATAGTYRVMFVVFLVSLVGAFAAVSVSRDPRRASVEG
jgi:sugar phosphate permease